MLKKNDMVDIVSLGTASSSDEIKKIKNYVKKIGLIPNIFLEKETTLKKSEPHEFPSCTAETRFEQLKKSIENPDSKIIWCSRGGYGTAEILPFLMKMKKPKTQKIFIGFSDISSLNIFLIQKWNWKVVSAPMLIQLALAKVSKKSEKAILDLVFGKVEELRYELVVATCGLAQGQPLRGVITGGCISVLAGHFGTQNQIDWSNKILFLEDEGEDGERLDRHFHQIATIITEQKKIPTAIILGNFLEANPHGTPKEKNIKIAIKKFAEKLPQIPIFQEKTNCLGHSRDMLPLLLGTEAKIIANKFLVQKV
jgi:muramoyltetrapeptide carboxypeptidase